MDIKRDGLTQAVQAMLQEGDYVRLIFQNGKSVEGVLTRKTLTGLRFRTPGGGAYSLSYKHYADVAEVVWPEEHPKVVRSFFKGYRLEE